MKQFLSRFDAIVARMQDQTATSDEFGNISFKQLDVASDQLANLLASGSRSVYENFGYLGGPNANRILSCLSTIKAGAGFVQLDPEDPVASLKDLADTCEITRIITEPQYVSLAQSLSEFDPLVVPNISSTANNTSPFRRSVRDGNLPAVTLHTSGTTGKPKCVPLSYLGFDLRLDRKYRVAQPPAVKPHKTAYFNYFRALQELSSLQNGDMLHYFDLRRYGLAAMAEWMREKRITLLTAQVSVFRQLIASTELSFPDVSDISLVGESLLRPDLEKFNQFFLPGTILVSRFSASEHCDVTAFRHVHGDPIEGSTQPLGDILYPENTRLVDESGRDVKEGETGEILVTGDFIPHGYLNDPERSAAVFSPVLKDSDEWVCRSGFLAYRDAGGTLYPVGRKDDQVKIRGFTILLHEVEQLIEEHPDVLRAAVLPIEGARNIRRLDCYFIPANGSIPTAKALRKFVSTRAPYYMIPSAIHAIEEMPVSPTGKVLKRELANQIFIPGTEQGFDAEVVGKTERAIFHLWVEVLGFRDFSCRDNFFDTGGDSLQAMSMLISLERLFAVRLPLESLMLDGSSIKDLARKIDRLKMGTADRVIVLKNGKGSHPIFCPPVVGGHLSDYLHLAHAINDENSILGLHPKGLDHAEKPATTIQEMAADAIIDIKKHNPSGPYRLLGFSFGGLIAYEVSRALLEQGEAVSHLILLDPAISWSDKRRYYRWALRSLIKRDVRGAISQLSKAWHGSFLSDVANSKIDDAHRFAGHHYQPKPLPHTKALMIVSDTNASTTNMRIQQWKRLLGGGLTICSNNGDHMDLIRPPTVKVTAGTIEKWLNEQA